MNIKSNIKPFLPKHIIDLYRFIHCHIPLSVLILTGKIIRLVWTPRFPENEEGKLFLHLGCGNINKPGFINIDAVPKSHIHYVRAIDNLTIFENNTISLIYSSHCLEHISHRELPNVLNEWYRVLKKEGILRLAVPDFDTLLKIYKENDNEVNSIIRFLMGGQSNKFDYHYSVFTYSSLSSLLHETGFREVRRWQAGASELTTFQDWSAGEIDVKGKKYPVSLNIEAVK